MSTLGHGFLAGSLAIDSLRKSGYKNVAYALGELVDNSIQEDASAVDILIGEKQVPNAAGQMVWRIDQIAVLDNGNGMDHERLWRALRIGDGDAQRGIKRGKSGNQMGKFGVGLPQASISQCRKVDIWSWQNGGHENSEWVSINLDDKEWFQKDGLQIREPEKKKIPKKWIKNSDIFSSDSGTLIVWDTLDRVNWKTSQSIFKHSEFLIGRMYRNHISSGQTEIRLLAFENVAPFNVRNKDRNNDGYIDDDEKFIWTFQANDPLYLDENAEAGNPPRNPMFDQAGDTTTMEFMIPNEKTGVAELMSVELKFSKACVAVRKGHNFDGKTMGGSQPHGIHARRNMGLSIVRNGRELELDDGWCTTERNAAYERWWGAEISFGSEMDHIFDVTNNKQHAQNLNDVAKKRWDYWKLDDEDESLQDIKNRVKNEDFAMWVCMTIAEEIRTNLGILRKQIFAENPTKKKKNSENQRHDNAEKQSTSAIEERKAKGYQGESDQEEGLDDEEKKERLAKALEDAGISQEDIEDLTGDIVNLGYKVVYQKRSMDSDAFFSVEKQVGTLIVYLNTNHRAYKYLIGVLIDIENNDLDLNDEDDEEDLRGKLETLNSRIMDASTAFKVMISAWARYEDESKGEDRRSLTRVRREWGKLSDDFLKNTSNEDDDDWTN